jgi:hypothetical protein
MNVTALNSTKMLFDKGGASIESPYFQLTDKPLLIIAFGLSPTTSIKLQMLDMASQELPDTFNICDNGCGESYPNKDELIPLDAQDVCGFKICKASYIGKVLVAGWYRAIMSDNTSLTTAKVWAQETTIDVALNLPACPNCP